MSKPINVAELLKQGKTIEEVMEILRAQVVETESRIRDQKTADKTALVNRIKSGEVTLEDAEVVTTMAIKNEFPGLAKIIDEEEGTAQSALNFKDVREIFSELESIVRPAPKAKAKAKESNMDLFKTNPKKMTPQEADEALKKFLGL